jgi:3'-phosphoadenosine 5'-phosphosulfate sulfotransferase (PAPS reductase)/FAD synthetase
VTTKVRHILSLSGGKDSTALAIYMRDRAPEMEYVFCDTRKELRETYEYLARVEAYLGKPIVRLHDDRGFDHWLDVYGGYLPSSRMRWCTRQLKIRPFERYVGEDVAVSYIGIRADEQREGYISTKPNITARYPFKEDGIVKADVLRILEESGLGIPPYYKWRTRSGCYFCFFQRKIEWVGLKENHPDLFEKSKRYEKVDSETGERYTWSQGESLEELEQPARTADIREQHQKYVERPLMLPNRPLHQILADDDEDDDEERACLICDL